MGNVTAIKGMDSALSAAGAKSAAARQTEQAEGDFQKLLNGKSEENTGTKETAGTKKDDKQQEVAKEEESEKPEAKEEPKETNVIVPEDPTALEQVQAALLFQIQPETSVAETAPEEVAELVTELGAVVPEEQPETPILAAEQPEQVHTQETAAPEETLQKIPVSEQAVLPEEKTPAAPEAELRTAKPKETQKSEVREQPDMAARPEQQPLESVRPEAQSLERTPVTREVPTEHVPVAQPEEIPEKVLDQLLVKTTAGIREFEIQLEPYDLGKIIIKAAFGKEHASISILCTEQRTMELMAKNARELGAIMEENLGTPTTIVVEDKETGYLEQQRQNNEGSGGNQSQEEASKRQNEKNQEKEGMDFLQQLRLGLI